MTFNSMDALKNYILTHSEVAVEKARDKVAMVINHFLTQYYKEFDPEVYVRTYQLLCSLIKSDVKFINNGWVAEVYFDLDALNYATRIVPARFSGASGNNTFHRENWTKENDEWVLKTAMVGSKPHGGYAGGTAIWTESVKVLSKQGIDLLKQELIKAGIPVR